MIYYNPGLNRSLPHNGQVPISKDTVKPAKASHSKPLIDSLTFPEIKTTQADIRFMTKKTPIQNSLLHELDELLESQATQIEKEFEELEKGGIPKDLINASAKMQEWGQLALNLSNQSVSAGIKFLQQVLPPHLLNQDSLKQKLGNLGEIFSLQGTFLNALDNGFQGLAIICKYKILRESKELLHQVKKHHGIETANASQIDTTKNAEQQKIYKQILEWESQIQAEEKSLAQQSLELGLSTTSTLLDLVNIPLTYLPKEMLLAPLKLVSTGIPLASSGLDVAVSGLKLKQTTKDASILNHWMHSYKKWQQDVQTKNQSPDPFTNLLAKRETIKNTKIQSLKTNFQDVALKIRLLIKPEFERALQELEKTLLDPSCNFNEVEEQFKKWQLVDPSLNANPKLSDAFKNFKNAVGKNAFPIAKQNLIDALNQWKKDSHAMDQHFDKWFSAQPKNRLLEKYVDHQETLEITTKNALKQMVGQKHILENRLFNFKLTQSTVNFSIALLVLIVSVSLVILGIITAPLGGIAVILAGLSLGSTAVSLGLFGAGYLHYKFYKPHTAKTMTLFFQVKMAWTKLKASLHTYFHQAKEKKLLEVAQVLYKLHPLKKEKTPQNSIQYQKALLTYKKAKRDFEKSQTKVNHWVERLKHDEAKLVKAGWKDFAQYASLQNTDSSTAFDTLHAFKEAFQACNLHLLSEETKTLLEIQLGVNLEDLQTQMQQEPEMIKKTLQEFFVLEDAAFVNFIKTQQTRIKKGLLRPQTT